MRFFARTLPLFALLAFACGESKPSPETSDNNGPAATEGEPVALLDMGALYDPTEIRAMRERATDSLKKESHEHFARGADLLFNQEDPKASIPVFEESLSFFPEAKTYFALGAAYRKTGQHAEALQAYTAAKLLDYAPNANLLFEQACVELAMGKEKEGLKTLEASLKEGFADRQRFLDEEPIMAVAEHKRKDMYLNYLKDKNNPKQAYFDLFIKGFPEGELPFKVTTAKLEKLIDTDAHYISWDFHEVLPAMEDAEFAREVTEEFTYVAKLLESDGFILVAYGGVNYMGWLPTHYVTLATYSRDGAQIDEVKLCSNEDPYTHREGVIESNLKVTVTELKNEWAKDYDEHGPKDNHIVKKMPKTPTNYRLNSKGQFVKMLGS